MIKIVSTLTTYSFEAPGDRGIYNTSFESSKSEYLVFGSQGSCSIFKVCQINLKDAISLSNSTLKHVNYFQDCAYFIQLKTHK